MSVKSQIKKIYFASFLKNQTYFVPIMVVFFQDLGLSYSEIFWIYTIDSVFSFIIEIPTGIFADLFGKRRSIIFSKLFIFLSFISFGFAFNFWTLLIANLIYELGRSFRSGTETAYVFDYLQENKNTPSYTRVKSDQKFYARLSESLAAFIGGFLAVKFGFSWVFFIATIPAFINFIQTLTWDCIKENSNHYSIKQSFAFAGQSLKSVFTNKILFKIVLNILLFEAVLFASEKFVQPYMRQAGIQIEYFGVIYSVFLLLTAFVVRYVSRLEDKFGGERIINYVTIFAFLPLLILGLGYSSIIGVILFFLVIIADNLRSPISNSVFHDNVQSHNRATMGSILELFKTSGNLIILPLAGYLADFYSLYTALLIFSFVILLTGVVFWLPNVKRRNI